MNLEPEIFEALKNQGIILYPTDTIWGIGCDATKENSVKKIYEIKQRNDSKSLLMLVDSFDMLARYVKEIPEIAEQLVEYSEKPLTIIYPNAINLPKNLINEDGTIGIRVTKDEFCKAIMRRTRKPLVSTSANISGQASPANFSEISEEIKNAVDYVVKYRQDDVSKAVPSSIIKLGLKGEIQIIRK